VNVHHVDKASYLKGNVDCVDPDEVVMVFANSPNNAEVVGRVMMELKWIEPSDLCKLVWRDVGYGHHNLLKVMPVDSELNWSAYKESVAASQDICTIKYSHICTTKLTNSFLVLNK
jgi:hypothetical protein